MSDSIRFQRANSSATFSSDGVYRYALKRTWENCGSAITFVMLNPSTADDVNDDPTIRRCIGFAKREGYGVLNVVNLYAMRTTRPIHLLDIPDPEGPENLIHVKRAVGEGPIIAAWGASATSLKGLPTSSVLDWLLDRGATCLGVTKDGHPKHPLYLPKDAPTQVFFFGQGESK